MNKEIVYETFVCKCSTELIYISYWKDDAIKENPEDRMVFLSWMGRKGSMGFGKRLAIAWTILTTGKGWMDEVILDKDDAIRLFDTIGNALSTLWPKTEQSQ